MEPRRPGGDEPAGKASAGNVGSAGSASTPADVVDAGSPAVSSRFLKLAAVLELMQASGELSHAPPVTVPPSLQAFRGGDAVWRLPAPPKGARRGWTVLSGTKSVRRTAMVATVRLHSTTVHLIEVEEDLDGSGSAMLLCRLRPGHEAAGVESLLRAVARKDVAPKNADAKEGDRERVTKAEGVWPKPAAMNPLVVSTKVWRHQFDDSGALDRPGLLRALRRAVATDLVGGGR